MKKNKCYSCGSIKIKNKNGLIECQNCFSIRWNPTSYPTPNKQGSGIKCIECGKKTVFKIGLIAGAVVWICTNKKKNCGCTYVESLETAALKSKAKLSALLKSFSEK